MAVAIGKPILMSSTHWHEPWFSQCCGLDIRNFDVFCIDDSSAEDFDVEGHVTQLCDKLKGPGPLPIISATDATMIVHSMTKDSLKKDTRFANMTGASLCATVLCDHKLLTRALVPRCDILKFKGVRSEDAVIPAIEGVKGDMILKPIAAIGSANVHVVRAGQPSPFHNLKADNSGALHKATFLHLDRFGASVPGATDSIGLLEEYVAPAVRKVSVDGAFVRGVVTPWCIADNVYYKDRPEVFDALEAPTSLITPAEQENIWEIFSEVCHGLHRLSNGDFDCQFICIEMFVHDAKTIDIMEVNIRVSANHLPAFHRIMDGGCPLLAQVKMQGPKPELTKPKPNGTYSCTLYRAAVDSAGALQRATPDVDGYDAVYYHRNKVLAHIYGYGDSPAGARAAAEALYAKVKYEGLAALAKGGCKRKLQLPFMPQEAFEKQLKSLFECSPSRRQRK